jgi:hypothetical protein
VAATFRQTLSLEVADPAIAGSASYPSARDPVATSHDYVDATPRNVSTTGVVGSAFIQLETPVQQVERLAADLPLAADLVLRVGGAVALLLGTQVAPVFVGGETLDLAVDAAVTVTTTFQAGDNTLSLIARRINYAHAAQVADLSPTGHLRLQSFRTGGADAFTKGWSYGRLYVVGGSALAALGLAAGAVYGQGDDQRLGPGPFAKTFPASALPRRLELSGSAQGARFWIAGKAS